jgi:hypothetical protein
MITSSLFLLTLLAPPKLTLRVDGEGYLRLCRDGRAVFAATATFEVVEGRLRDIGGAEPLPKIFVPGDATALDCDLEGHIFAITAGGKAEVGRLVLGRLKSTTTDGRYTISIDRPQLGSPGEDDWGVIRREGVKSTPTKQPELKPKQAEPKPKQTSQPQISPKTIKTPIESSWTGPAEIVVRPESTVSGESFSLAEVAEIHGKPEEVEKLGSVNLGRSPAFGVSRGLDRNFVLMQLRAAGIDVDKVKLGPFPMAKITRAAQFLTVEKQLEVALGAVKAKYPSLPDLTFTTDPGALKLPNGELQIKVMSVNKSPQSITVGIQILVDGQVKQTRMLGLAPAGGFVSLPSGTKVKIIMRVGGASVSTEGKLAGSAWIGETVSAKLENGTVVTGVLKDAQTLEVQL